MCPPKVRRPIGNNSAPNPANQTLETSHVPGQTDTQLNVESGRQTRNPVDQYGAKATYSLGLRDHFE